MMKGKTDMKAARILIPFDTKKSQFSAGVTDIPLRANLIFEAIINDKQQMEYRFSGVDMRCWCDECQAKENAKSSEIPAK